MCTIKLKTLILVFFLSVTTIVSSQDIITEGKPNKAPVSIYTNGIPMVISRFDTDFFSYYVAEQKFRFRIIDQQEIAQNNFMIDFRNIGRKASIYDYESYKKATLNTYLEVVPDIVILNRFSNPQFTTKN